MNCKKCKIQIHANAKLGMCKSCRRKFRKKKKKLKPHPYFRLTLGTAWAIRKKWIPNSELLRLREKYKDGVPNTTVEKKITKRIPRTSE